MKQWLTPLEILNQRGNVAYLCGGCVRDHLLGRFPKDVDIATNARPATVMTVLREYGYHCEFVGESFGVVLCITPFGACEIATFRKDGVYSDGRRPDEVEFAETAEEDSNRRDFTINAMFMDSNSTILDYHGGQEDLVNHKIRCVGVPHDRFKEDKLRMLRAIRFASQLGFELDDDIVHTIRTMGPTITTVSWERIGNELVASLKANPRSTLGWLWATGLDEHILPEIAAQKSVDQDTTYHPEGNVFIHTYLVLEYLGTLPQEWRDEVTVLTALLHDVAKPQTQTIEGDRIHFYQHEVAGVPIIREVLRRLRRPEKVIEDCEWIEANHLKLFNSLKMRKAKVLRLLRDKNGERLLRVAWCDAMGGCRLGLEGLRHARDLLRETPPEVIRPVRLITGHDLIEMGMSPGPLMGRLLAEVEDMQLEGTLSDRDSAIEFVKAKL